ncbi:LysR substrate-binding domain-containing protein [Erwinia sp. AnSW2-5]|uniref:LysR substrate-binding domain-containing protein n=1 Tax=Erwinia sp. AnSW2-5 TaxID=3367692 RepID=UPI00385D1B5F
MRYLPKMQQLRIFQEVVNQGSIRAAARMLGQSQPAISRTLKELEYMLETSLFVRSPLGITLTPSGQLFVVRSRRILEELKRAGDEIRFLHTQHSVVKVALNDILSLTVLPEVLEQFHQQLPLTRLYVQDRSLPSQLLAGELDFAVSPQPEVLPDGLAIQPLFKTSLNVVANRHHPQVQTNDLQQLRGSKWLFAGEESEVAVRLDAHLATFFQQLEQPPVYTHSLSHGLQLVQQANYLMLLPHPLLIRFNSTLRALAIPALPSLHYAAVWPKQSPLTASAQRLLMLIRQACKQLT